ncbi:MAG: caspase family protein [Phycisphaerales bacterium]
MEHKGRALLVGINKYDHKNRLTCCRHDAEAMAEALSTNDDGGVNYDCEVLGGQDGSVDKPTLKDRLRNWLFAPDWTDDSLFYFAGHGAETLLDGRLITTDKTDDDALPMFEVLKIASLGKARNTTIILDCCHAGHAGNVPALGAATGAALATLPFGMSILAAASQRESADESDALGHGLFTAALLAGLRGGAADLRGHVTPAGLFAYAQSFFSAGEQQPVFKAHVQSLEPIRKCKARVADDLLRELKSLFPRDPKSGEPKPITLDPSWDVEAGRQQKPAVPLNPKNNEKFWKLRALEGAGLLKVEPFDAASVGAPKGQDVKPTLFWAAYYSKRAALTPFGVAQWDLCMRGRFGRP